MRKPGLRLQLLLLLGGLLLVTFLPLQLALATYTQLTLRRVDDRQARAQATTLRAYVGEIQQRLTPAELVSSLREKFSASGLLAAQVSTPDLGVRASFGPPATLEALARAQSTPDEARLLRDGGLRMLPVLIKGERGREVWLAINAGQASLRGASLIRMFGLYAFLIGTSLLTLAYFALTRLIVRPLDQLSEAAQSVTLGSRHLDVPTSRVRELSELGTSLTRMTQRLLSDEESLRKKVDEVEQATGDLRDAQHQLVRSERLASVGRLAAGLAHEIGNPIAAVIGLQDLLLEGDLDPREQQDFIRRMRSETERINSTLRDLLEFARAPSASTSSLASGDVEAAIHDTATLVAHQASMQSLELKLDVYPGLPRVGISTEQLMQVLLNLLLNAADALEGAANGHLSVVAEAEREGVRIQVEDNGPGVDPAHVNAIFDPFFTTKDVGKGTGLGLSVCQGLVEAAHGTLSLDTSTTSGARFVLWLPTPRGSSGDTAANDKAI